MLPDTVMKLSEYTNQSKYDSQAPSEEDSLDSEDLEPRYKVSISRPDMTREEKEESKNNDIIDSESHDSYNSSNPTSLKFKQYTEMLNLCKKDAKLYSNKLPESSFPSSTHAYRKCHMRDAK